MSSFASFILSYIVQAYSIYEDIQNIQNIFNQKMAEALNLNETPQDKINQFYVAENDYWVL